MINQSKLYSTILSYAVLTGLTHAEPPAPKKSEPIEVQYSTKPVKGIPQSWVGDKGPDVLRYANFIQDLGLKNITPYDILYPYFKTRSKNTSSIPPRHLWQNIAPTLRVVDELASRLKAKTKPFLSIYRSPAHNRILRGRSKSQRLTNGALSVQFYGVDASKVTKAARQLRKEGFFKGGIGAYTSFTHIDTRGHNLDW